MVPFKSAVLSITFAFATLVIGFGAFAEDYFVSKNALGASDNNDGRSPVFVSGNRGPWKTVVRAGQVAEAGDTVFIMSGDYRNDSSGYGTGIAAIENTGTANAPIRFTAGFTSSLPVINRILVHDNQHIIIDGLQFNNPEFELPDNWQDMPAVVIDDPTVEIETDTSVPWDERRELVVQKYTTYMSMFDYFTTDYPNGIDVKNSHHVTIRNCRFEHYCFGIQVRNQCSNILLEENCFEYCLDGIFTWLEAPSMTDSIIRNNTFRQCFNTGMQVRENAQNVLIEGNDLQYIGVNAITVISGCSDSTVRGNNAEYGGYYTETVRYPGSSAINVHSSRGGIVVEQNYAAFQIDWTYLDGNGYMADLMLDSHGVLFRNNISYRNMGSGVRTVDSPNCVILNNTFVQDGWMNPKIRNAVGVYLAFESDINQTIINNIFYGHRGAGIKSQSNIDQQVMVDHNLYHMPRPFPSAILTNVCNGGPFVGSPPLIWDGYQFGEDVYRTLAEVRQHTPWEDHGVHCDPFFRGPVPNFRLLPWSTAIDVGMTLPLVPNDYDGNSRPQGNGYDIGAFENK